MMNFLFIALYALGGIHVPPNEERELKSTIYTALANGQRRIELAPGTWTLDLRDGKPLTLEGLSGIEIIGHGANIICNVPTQAIDIKGCKDIRISGLTIDYNPLPFTQGRIIALDTGDRMWMDVEIYEGYRTDMIDGRLPDRVQVFDPATRQLRKNLYTYFSNAFRKVEKIEGRVFRFHKSRQDKNACEALHDDIVFSLPYPGKTRAHTIVISKSEHIQLEDVTLYAGNCFGFFEIACNGNRYHRCRVTLPETDPLLSVPRLRSNNADAFHSKYALHGPSITDCEFLYHADDGVAINSSFYRVISRQGNKIYVDAPPDDIKIQKDQRVRFVDYAGKVAGDAVVTALEGSGTYPAAALDSMCRLFELAPEPREKVTLLTLDRAVETGTGSVVSSLDMAGSGFEVKHNRIGYTRARGILIKASDGVIEDNTVIGCELGGIVLAPELDWLEAGFSRNVLIKNNLVKDCMFANSSYGIEQAAPISVIAVNAQRQVAPAGGFSNIRIIGNRIENSPVPAIIATSLSGGEIRGNRIHISREIIRSHGRRYGVDNTQPIWQMNTTNLQVHKNKIKR